MKSFTAVLFLIITLVRAQEPELTGRTHAEVKIVHPEKEPEKPCCDEDIVTPKTLGISKSVILKVPDVAPMVPEIPPIPSIDVAQLAALEKLSGKVATVAKAGMGHVSTRLAAAKSMAGKVLGKIIAVPKAIGKFILKKPLLHLAKKKALAGGVVALAGKKTMGVGAKIGLVGAKTAALGKAITGASVKGMGLLGVPVAGIASKAAKYIPGLGFVMNLEPNLINSVGNGLGSMVFAGDVFTNWIGNNHPDEEVVLVEDEEPEVEQGNKYYKYDTVANAGPIEISSAFSVGKERTKRSANQPELDLEVALRLLKMAEIQDCIARVICELGCDVKNYGNSGMIVFRNLMDLQMSGQVKSTEFDYYRRALMDGRRLTGRKQCHKCQDKYPKCKALTDDLLAVASLVKLV